MPILLTEIEIQRLIAEPKPLPADYRRRIQVKPKRGHKENELTITGNAGSTFRLILRQSLVNPLDFSVILAYEMPNTNQSLLLRRYNGKSHEHTNPKEGQTFYDFHIHEATERYQDSSHRPETFAQTTNRYADFDGAVDCVIQDCAFVLPPGAQSPLFS
jgi:hypothetical protein